MTKRELRENAIRQREQLTPAEVSRSSEFIQNRLFRHSWYLQSQNIFVYISMRKEIETRRFIDLSIQAGKTVSVPRLIPGEGMVAVPIENTQDDLGPGRFDFPEPQSCRPAISVKEIDLVIVPGLLFDRDGYRIGYGGGYYDRYLSMLSSNCKTIGLAYACQIIPMIPREEYDQKVMLVITEKEMIGG